MKKQLIAAGIVAATATAGLVGAGVANAESTTGTPTNPMSSLVKAIAAKFNLKEADVQAVVTANHTQMEQERENEVKTEVAQLVKDGKLTQPQADKINAKRAELEKERDAARAADQNLTEAQRDTKRQEMRAQMDTKRTELDTWLKANGIDAQYRYLLMGGRGHGGHGGERDGGRDGMRAKPQSSTSETAN